MLRPLLACCLAAATAIAEPVAISLSNQQLPAPVDITPRELWRLGGSEDDLLLGVIAAALVDADGNIYLLDTQLSEIQVFDAEGNHLRTIGREGEGPGEFRRAGGMFFVVGNICVAQRFPGRLVMFTPDGDPAGDLQVEGVEGMGGVQQGQSAPGRLVFSRASGRREGDGFVMLRTLAAHDETGKQLVVLAEAEGSFSPTATVIREDDMQNYENNWALLPDGTVVIGADMDHYRLEFRDGDGGTRVTVAVEHKLLARTAEEKAGMRGGVMMMGRGRGRAARGANAPEFVFRDEHPVFAKLDLGPDGKLWVLTARGARPTAKGVLAQYDVFESNGQLARRVNLRAAGSGAEDGIFYARGRMIVVHGYRDALRAQFGQSSESDEEEEELEAAPLEVVVYEIGG